MKATAAQVAPGVWAVEMRGKVFLFTTQGDALGFCAWLEENEKFVTVKINDFLYEKQLVEQQAQAGDSIPSLHKTVSALLYLSMFLFAFRIVEKAQIAALQKISTQLESFALTQKLEKLKTAKPEGKKIALTKGDVAAILGDEWAKRNFGDLKDKDWKDKLKIASEPAPQEWVQLAEKKQAERKKVSYPQQKG